MYDYNNSNEKQVKETVPAWSQNLFSCATIPFNLAADSCLHLACLAYLTRLTFLASVGYFLTVLSLETPMASQTQWTDIPKVTR